MAGWATGDRAIWSASKAVIPAAREPFRLLRCGDQREISPGMELPMFGGIEQQTRDPACEEGRAWGAHSDPGRGEGCPPGRSPAKAGTRTDAPRAGRRESAVTQRGATQPPHRQICTYAGNSIELLFIERAVYSQAG
jgi:hypothetical protein